jgi:hypothetical protein
VLFVSAILLGSAFAAGNPGCEFMQRELEGQQRMLGFYKDKNILAEAKANCSTNDWKCYDDLVKSKAAPRETGAEIIVPMGTDFDDCRIYYDPYSPGRDIPLDAEAQIESAWLDYLAKWGGGGMDDALEAFFDAVLAHERKHQEQCVNGKKSLNDKKRYEGIDGHSKSETEAYETSISVKKEWRKRVCGANTYCPCENPPRDYATQQECWNECGVTLSCNWMSCEAPP